MSVKRYQMQESVFGPFVSYKDFFKLEADYAALRSRVARLEGITRMLVGCIEDTKKYPDRRDDFVDELETARRALEEK